MLTIAASTALLALAASAPADGAARRSGPQRVLWVHPGTDDPPAPPQYEEEAAPPADTDDDSSAEPPAAEETDSSASSDEAAEAPPEDIDSSTSTPPQHDAAATEPETPPAQVPSPPPPPPSQPPSETQDTTLYKVVLNHEEQYSIWPKDRENALGWKDEGFSGTKEQCLAHIKEVWTDMRPADLRKKMEEQAKELKKKPPS